MSGENKWFICNSVTRFQSEAISHSDLSKKCSEVLEDEAANWHIWNQEWPAWKPLTECAEFAALIKPKSAAAPPTPTVMPPPLPMAPPPMPMAAPLVLNPVMPVSLAKPTTEDSTDEITEALSSPPHLDITQPLSSAPPPLDNTEEIPLITKEASAVTKSVEERRKHPRYEARLRVIIRNEEITFRTFSVDISLGGISLEQRVPDHAFSQQCQIFIAGPDGKENLRFTLSPTSRNDLKYFSFSNLEDRFVQRLQDWLDDIGPKVPLNAIKKHG